MQAQMPVSLALRPLLIDTLVTCLPLFLAALGPFLLYQWQIGEAIKWESLLQSQTGERQKMLRERQMTIDTLSAYGLYRNIAKPGTDATLAPLGQHADKVSVDAVLRSGVVEEFMAHHNQVRSQRVSAEPSGMASRQDQRLRDGLADLQAGRDTADAWYFTNSLTTYMIGSIVADERARTTATRDAAWLLCMLAGGVIVWFRLDKTRHLFAGNYPQYVRDQAAAKAAASAAPAHPTGRLSKRAIKNDDWDTF